MGPLTLAHKLHSSLYFLPTLEELGCKVVQLPSLYANDLVFRLCPCPYSALSPLAACPSLFPRYLTDEELDAMLPGPEQGYKVLVAPAGYKPITEPARKAIATPTPWGAVGGATPLYHMPEENNAMKAVLPDALEGLPDMKAEDMQVSRELDVRWWRLQL